MLRQGQGCQRLPFDLIRFFHHRLPSYQDLGELYALFRCYLVHSKLLLHMLLARRHSPQLRRQILIRHGEFSRLAFLLASSYHLLCGLCDSQTIDESISLLLKRGLLPDPLPFEYLIPLIQLLQRFYRGIQTSILGRLPALALLQLSSHL